MRRRQARAKADREPPRSLVSARRRLADANVAIISVAGEYATLEAHRALSAGMHVFLFSDHVSLEDELELKQRGEQLGRLVMGPGCGTAMLGNVGLGFANVVTSGPVGIVAAAGTGAQESACLLDAAGVGVSQIVGVGGRDLSADIGGIMFRQAMHMLAADDETETLLLVSKPPAPEVVASLAGDLPEGKRVVAAFVGWEGDGDDAPFEIYDTLEAGARAAAGTEPEDIAELEQAVDAARERSAGRRLLGLFSGGSLAHEAVTLLEPELGPLEGNVGHGADERNGGHAILDLGEEEYTQGRPHPMVDLDVRLGFLEEAAEDENVGCVLLDVVLGHGGHTDPASGLSDAIAAAAKNAIVLARVCGTAGDPQDAGAPDADPARRRRDRRAVQRRRLAAGAAGDRPRSVAGRRGMKLAMLTYSVKPRGGVEHALAVAEALAGRGHDVCCSALAQPGEVFFRETTVQTRLVAHVPTTPPSTSASWRWSTPTARACGRCWPRAASTSSTRRTASRPTPPWTCATRASSSTSCAPCTTSTNSSARH